MTVKTFFHTTKDGTEICVNRWIPDEEIKGIVVISHGMAEHSMRYDRVASYFVEHGFLVNAHDHRGHGKTALKQKEKGQVGFGYLADKDGDKLVKEDLKEIVESLKTEYSDKKIFILSHSFGSFVLQSFMIDYSDLCDGYILCGTRGPMKALVNSAYILSSILIAFGQKKKISNLLDYLAFSSYNNKIANPRTNFDWLSKDNMYVDMYLLDSWCGFKMTTEFFNSMFKLLKYVHKSSNIKKVNQDKSVLLIAGDADPVGNYGKTVEALYKIYQDNGIKDLNLTLYKDDRHELLNETDSTKVIEDVIKWLEDRI